MSFVAGDDTKVRLMRTQKDNVKKKRYNTSSKSLFKSGSISSLTSDPSNSEGVMDGYGGANDSNAPNNNSKKRKFVSRVDIE